MNLIDQKKRFEKIWHKFFPLFGTKVWEENPNFLYFIEIPLPTNLWTEMEKLTSCLKKQNPGAKGLWFPPQRMHITVALPGRLGEHFQGNAIKVMIKKLQEISQKTAPFTVSLGNINCFADVLFREVYDINENLQILHEEICQKIPFSQNPEYQFANFLPHISLFLGQGTQTLFSHTDFSRELDSSPLTIDRIFFGKARNDEGKYEKRILQEFRLKGTLHSRQQQKITTNKKSVSIHLTAPLRTR